MNIKKSLLLVLLCGVLVSCGVPLSVNPLSDPADAKHDGRLSGAWHSTEDDVFLHIGRAEDGNKSRVMSIEHKQSGELDVFDVTMFVSKIDAGSFMNIDLPDKVKDEGDDNDYYMFLKYEVLDNDTLVLCALDVDVVREAIKSGTLKGEVSRGDVLITDTTEQIVGFLKSAEADKLFVRLAEFKRVTEGK